MVGSSDTGGIPGQRDGGMDDLPGDGYGDTPGDQNDVQGSVGIGWRIFGVTIITLLYTMNTGQSFLLNITIFKMAKEFEFGDRTCEVINQTAARELLGDANITGAELCAETGRCTENNTNFLPEVCSIVFTGQGTLHDVLVGPIFLLAPAFSTIPLVTVAQSVPIRAPYKIAVIAALWSLTTLLTAFVNHYWGVALFRFLWGIFNGPFSPLALAYITSIVPLNYHALAFGIAKAGEDVGIGVSYLFNEALDEIGWRMCYLIMGSTGLCLAGISTYMASGDGSTQQSQKETPRLPLREQLSALRGVPWSVMIPTILVITGHACTNSLNDYNLVNFLAEYYPRFDVSLLAIISFAIVIPAELGGGKFSDLVREKFGVRGRLWLSLLLESLLAITLPMIYQTPAPFFMVFQGVSSVFLAWNFITILAIISDLTPSSSKEVVFAIYVFFMNVMAGTINLTVSPLTSVMGFRTALTFLTVSLVAIRILCTIVAIVAIHFRERHKLHDGSLRGAESERKKESMDESTPLTVLN